MPASSQLSIRNFDNEIPEFAERAIERLYGNLFSLPAYDLLFNDSRGVSTYAVFDGDVAIAVWLYRREEDRVRVITEGMPVEEFDATRFADYLFRRFPAVHAIAFHAVEARMRSAVLPFQRANCLEDMVLALPSSATAYTAALGKSTRNYIHRYLNKLRRDYPSFRFQTVAGCDTSEPDIRRIVELNHLRMAGKGKESIHHQCDVDRIVALARDRGMLGLMTIDGRICAGTINYRVRDNYFLEVVAHDPSFDDYRLGTLCCYLTICECIVQGGGEYHFLWGQDAYKSHLLGVRRDLDDLVIYRSHARMLMLAGLAGRHLLNDWRRRAQLRLRKLRSSRHPLARYATALLNAVRSARSGLRQRNP